MKKLLFLATGLITLASCSENDFVGDEAVVKSQQEEGMITFSTSSQNITRAEKTGEDAAKVLNKNFVVEGVKWNGNDTRVTVFDNYNVNYVKDSKNSTLSNTSDWEYVAQATNVNANVEAQSIKYWDYAKTQYDFIAYSVGTATLINSTPPTGKLKVSPINATNMNGVKTSDVITDGAYTIEGAADDLKKAYIADLVTVYRDGENSNDGLGDYQKVVKLKFRSLSAKVRIALYETIPGYSVKDVVFYTDAGTKATDAKAHLYTTGTDAFNGSGKYIVYFPTTGSANKENNNTDYNKAHLKFEPAATDDGTSKGLALGALSNFASKEVAETAESVYLGRSSNAATFAGKNDPDHYYTVVLPNEAGAVLNLKVDYTLLSTDKSGETIKVTGAEAQVPAVYAAWKSGYAYTYLFKISENTNGKTNPGLGPDGLYPITFDAVVTETEDGVQETITTVAEPSITTYAKGVVVTQNDEYLKGNNIYVVVENTPVLTVGTNAELYTVTLENGAAQTINEASVANALAKGTQSPTGTWTVTDANGMKMVVTKSDLLTAVTEIPAADAPDGNAITVNGAKFTPAAKGIYVFEYTSGTDKYYKIIRVSDPAVTPVTP